jgi:hypothetical protein
MPWRHRGEWRCSSTVLDLGTRWRWVVNFTPLPLNPRGKNPRCRLYRKLESLLIKRLKCFDSASWRSKPVYSAYNMSEGSSDLVLAPLRKKSSWTLAITAEKTTTPSIVDWVGKFVFFALVPYGELRLSSADSSLVQGNIYRVFYYFNIFVLALTDGLCCGWLVYPILVLVRVSGDME